MASVIIAIRKIAAVTTWIRLISIGWFKPSLIDARFIFAEPWDEFLRTLGFPNGWRNGNVGEGLGMDAMFVAVDDPIEVEGDVVGIARQQAPPGEGPEEGLAWR